MITIKPDKCIGCGKCVEDCLPKNIEIIKGKAQSLGLCMECGHCFAICPSKAIRITGMKNDCIVEFEDAVEVVSDAALMNSIKKRRSVRQYKDKAVSNEIIEDILEAGRYAPTEANNQGSTYTIVKNELTSIKEPIWESIKTLIDKKSEMSSPLVFNQMKKMYLRYAQNSNDDAIFFNAAALIIIQSPSDADAYLSASNIELMANAKGLGTLYSGYIKMALLENEALCDKLEIKRERLRICMLLGYPDVEYLRSVPRRKLNIKWK